MFKISHKLKLKLLDEREVRVVHHLEKTEINFQGMKHQVPGISWHEISLDLRNDPELFSECEEWQLTISSFKDYKLNIGQFEGLWPVQCNQKSMIVNFLADAIYTGRKHWKDWFMEGEEHAPQ